MSRSQNRMTKRKKVPSWMDGRPSVLLLPPWTLEGREAFLRVSFGQLRHPEERPAAAVAWPTPSEVTGASSPACARRRDPGSFRPSSPSPGRWWGCVRARGRRSRRGPGAGAGPRWPPPEKRAGMTEGGDRRRRRPNRRRGEDPYPFLLRRRTSFSSCWRPSCPCSPSWRPSPAPPLRLTLLLPLETPWCPTWRRRWASCRRRRRRDRPRRLRRRFRFPCLVDLR